METATYKLLNGTDKTIEYDPDGPCICCGLPVIKASMGGTVICPWCDTGYSRHEPGVRIFRKYGPGNPHPEYLKHYNLQSD